MKHKIPTLIFLAASLHLSVQAQQMNPATNEFLVNQQISGTQIYPRVASDEDGGYVIAWTTTGNTIMARRYGADHQPVTDEIQVTTAASKAFVYYWKEGSYLIAWTGNPSGMKVLQADNALSTTYALGSSDEMDLDVRGDIVLAAYPSSGHIYLRKWDLLTQAWAGAAMQASEAPSNDYKLPQVRWTSTGGIVAVYSNGSGTRRIYRKTFNANLLAQTPEEILQTTSGTVNVVKASINVHDQLLIFAKFGVNGTDVFQGQVLDADGTVLAASVGNMSAPYAYYYSDCELFDNGAVVLTNNYMTSLNDPENYNVRVNYGISFGSPNTGWQVASNTVSGEQRYPAVAKLPNGGFVMVWNGNGFQGDADGVYARAFDAAGFPGLTTATPLPMVVDETGTTQSLGLRLGIAPTGNVVVDLTVSDPTEASISAAQLTFSSTNWNQTQTVTITGVDNAEDDGDITLHVLATMNTSTEDPIYASLPPQQFAVVNRDDDATLTMPGDLNFCRVDGIAAVVISATNNGDPLGAPTVVSSNPSIVPDAAITVTEASTGIFHISISELPDNAPGTTTLTFSVSDGTFNYSGNFEVATLGVAPQITWADMELVSTAATTYQWYLDEAAIAGANDQTWTPVANGNYTVETTDGDGCTDLSEIFYFGSTGLGSPVPMRDLHVFPVPARGIMTVQGAEPGDDLFLHDLSGRQVARTRVVAHEATFDLSPIAQGCYLLRVSGSMEHSQLVVVE
ncbi:MAG TPA: T9SS type A sorting domain-containing protein [Flavobacteriales bacterium]|nr:T9SS type A sorting domain-containing protein [Flavobacteriales bacterium]